MERNEEINETRETEFTAGMRRYLAAMLLLHEEFMSAIRAYNTAVASRAPSGECPPTAASTSASTPAKNDPVQESSSEHD